MSAPELPPIPESGDRAFETPTTEPISVAGGGQTSVWVFPLSVDAQAMPALARLLQPDEQERARRYRMERDRNRFVVARGRLRQILARFLGEDADEIRFHYENQGKPSLAGHPLHFNLSHSGEWGALAVAAEPVGMDLERIRQELEAEALAERFFSSADRAWLQSRPAAGRRHDFYRLWVAREARLKATGEGLVFPLSRLLTRFRAGAITAVEEEGGQNRWHIRELDLVEGYCAAVAMAGAPPEVTVYRLAGEPG